jgi:hypothetical protein
VIHASPWGRHHVTAVAVQAAVLLMDRWPSQPWTLAGQRIAAGVAQHVRVGLELQAGAGRRALDSGEAGCGGHYTGPLLNQLGAQSSKFLVCN